MKLNSVFLLLSFCLIIPLAHAEPAANAAARDIVSKFFKELATGRPARIYLKTLVETEAAAPGVLAQFMEEGAEDLIAMGHREVGPQETVFGFETKKATLVIHRIGDRSYRYLPKITVR